jgi:hypothetical protein
MTRLPATTLLPFALGATTMLLCACGSHSSSTAATSSEDGARSSSPAAPVDPLELKEIDAGTALEPATYAMPMVGVDGPLRAVVNVPAGYFSAGGWVIDDGHGTLAPDEYGNLAFWGAVDQVDPDPCYHQQPPRRVGPSVGDLAEALVAQRDRITSRPVRVTLGGYDALYVESRPRGHLNRCRGGEHDLFRPHAGDPFVLADDIPGTTDRLWIVNVNGRRVVAAVQTMRGNTANPAQLVGIARSVRFSHVGHSAGQPFRPGP